jgi:soluble lytic murein transglycosylase-like protein
MSLLIAAAASVIVAPAQAGAIDQWQSHINEASKRFDIPATWIRAVIAAESNGDPKAVSREGAMGLMQLMPATWDELRAVHRLGSDPFDPRQNILAGTAYLKAMYDRFGYPGLFAAYNAGPARYEEHLRTGKPLPAETRAYLEKLAQTPPDASKPPAVLSGTLLFFPLRTVKATAPDRQNAVPSAELFVPLSTPSKRSDDR